MESKEKKKGHEEQWQDGNKDTDLLKNGLEDMGRGRGEI